MQTYECVYCHRNGLRQFRPHGVGTHECAVDSSCVERMASKLPPHDSTLRYPDGLGTTASTFVVLDRYARAALPTKLRHSYEDAYFRALTSRLLRVEDLEMRDQGLLESEIRDTFEDALSTPLGIRFTVLCGSDSTCTVTVHVRDRSPSTQLDSIDAIRSTSTKFRGRANLVVTFADDLQHTSDS